MNQLRENTLKALVGYVEELAKLLPKLEKHKKNKQLLESYLERLTLLEAAIAQAMNSLGIKPGSRTSHKPKDKK